MIGNIFEKNNKKNVLIISVAAIIVLIVGITIAFIIAQTKDVSNQFQPSQVTCAVEETFNGTAKTNVCIKNTGNIDAYIRAKIVVNWVDENGNIYGTAPSSDDYEIKWKNYGDNGTWFEQDGYWYFKNPVQSGNNTDVLIYSCSLKEGITPPTGYYLSVEIIAEAIQADGESLSGTAGEQGKAPVEIAWGVKVNTAADGTKTISAEDTAGSGN